MAKNRTSERSYHHGDLRSALHEAALASLERGDEAGLSLRALARVAGVSAAAPYRHYDGREALLADVAAGGFHRLEAALAAARRSAATDDDALAATGCAYVRFGVLNRGLYRLMFSSSHGEMCDEVKAASRGAWEQLSDAVSLCVPRAGHRGDAAFGAWALVHGIVTLTIDGLSARSDGGPGGVVWDETLASRVEGVCRAYVSGLRAGR